MKHMARQLLPVLLTCVLFVSLTGCGVLNTATTEYNELVALVQGVRLRLELPVGHGYAVRQDPAKTQITKDYYDAVNKAARSGPATSMRRPRRWPTC
jgi:hypothetical protein